jgi:hypothetical protein
MRPCRAVQEHRLCARNWHVERSHFRLAIFKWDVSTVHASAHGCACRIGSRLGYSVVAIAELELNDIANSGNDGVGDESVLWATDYDWDDLVLATDRACYR